MKIIYNKIISTAIIALIMSIFCISCKREESTPEVKPLLKTNEAILFTANGGGINLSGEFILSGKYGSIQYGFDLDTVSTFKQPIVIPVGSNKEPDRFGTITDAALKPNAQYYVRTWAKTEKYVVYGNTTSFQSKGSSAPVIDKIVPDIALWGDTLKLIGKYLDYFGRDNRVYFNDLLAANSWGKGDTIWAIVPVPKDNNLSVYVEVYGKRSVKGVPFLISTPVISGINKTEGQYPDTITISGDNFSTYNTSIHIDGKDTEMFNVTSKSISVIVPYLKDDKSVKVELLRFSKSYTITDNFHYHGQDILNYSKNSAWIGDTLKLYAKNIDFRKIMLNINNPDPKLLSDYYAQYSQSLTITKKWKDSLEFILKGSSDASKFTLEVQFGKTAPAYPYKIFTTVDQKEVDHKAPLIVNMEKNEYIYGETINWKSKGLYILFGNQGHIIKSTDNSFVVNSSEMNQHTVNNGVLEPGNYSLQLQRAGKYSNPEYFTVKAPSIEGISPTPFTRDDVLQITGKNLPLYYNYTFSHLQSGRSFAINSWWGTTTGLHTEKMVGSGDYQVEMKIGDKSYKYPGVVHLNDYFDYQMKLTNPIPQVSSVGCGFSFNNKLYIPQQSGMMSIIDLTTGNVRSKPGYYNYDHQPVFLGDNIYMNIYKEDQRRTALCSFNKSTEEWDEVSMEGIPAGFVYFGMGVFNNHLLIFSNRGDIYQFDQKWNFIKNIRLDLYFIHYVYSKNDKLYICDFYKGQIIVISTLNFEILETIKMPGDYENSLRYVFELQDGLYYCGLARGGGDNFYDLYKFTSNETFEKLKPGKLAYDYYYHFCPDGKGNVYLVHQGYIYKFNH